jgi:hypothetical protein
MILMPVWIFEETEEGYLALLGSEPSKDAKKEFLSKEFVVSCVYAPGEGCPRFALLTLSEDIRKKNPGA